MDDVTSGRTDLSTIDRDHLPEPMRLMAPEAQEALINETAQRRKELLRSIQTLSDQRAAFLRKEVESLGGARDSLDHKFYSVVREQAAERGLRYQGDGPDY